MKFVLSRARKGDLLEARVLELQRDGSFVISFHGDLVRVKNESQRSLNEGDLVLLEILTVEPLGFRLIEKSRTFARSI